MTAAVFDTLRAFPMQDASSPPPPTSHANPFGGAQMAKMKFNSNVATISESKCNKELIDAGATHHFDHDRSLYVNYEPIDNSRVSTAGGESRIIDKDKSSSTPTHR